MSRLLRLTLVWLIVLALPMKSAMAVIPVACNEAGHGTHTAPSNGGAHTAVEQVAVGPLPAHGSHESRADGPGATSAATEHAQAHDGPVAALHASGAGDTGSGTVGALALKCSVCAPCCAAAAPGSEAAAPAEPDAVAHGGHEIEAWSTEVASDLPDRPPRQHFG